MNSACKGRARGRTDSIRGRAGPIFALAMPVLRFIEPCLPSPTDRPPSGTNWIHEIKHDGYRLMARRDSVGIRLITRRGNDWSDRFPLVVEAVNHLKVRSCLELRRNSGWRHHHLLATSDAPRTRPHDFACGVA